MSTTSTNPGARRGAGCGAAPGPAAAARFAALAPYAPPSAGVPIDLHLDANEGPAPPVGVLPDVSGDPSLLRRYPSTAALESELAARLGVAAARVLVTAGGDEAIDRVCRGFLQPGRNLVLPTPTFEMIARSARLAGAEVVMVPWAEGSYPTDAVVASVSEITGVVAVVSPNNPTGAVADAEDLRRLSAAALHAVLLVDLAYTEFADEDLTGVALTLPNAVIIRTFSKAYGLAGLRVGYAAGPEAVIRVLRAGAPYPVSAASLALARAALAGAEAWLPARIEQIRSERAALGALLAELGARPLASQANFVFAEFADAAHVWRTLASRGIAVRRFAPGSGLETSLRITCPGDDASFARLCVELRAALPSGAGGPSK